MHQQAQVVPEQRQEELSDDESLSSVLELFKVSLHK